jgi:hypothetical protein
MRIALHSTTSTAILNASPLSPHAVATDLLEKFKRRKKQDLSDRPIIDYIGTGVSLKNPILSNIYHLQWNVEVCNFLYCTTKIGRG